MGFLFRAFLASFLAALVVHARPSSLSLSFRASLPRMVVGNKGSTEVQGLWMYPLTRFFLSQFLMQLL
jgi:hypothetical protein